MKYTIKYFSLLIFFFYSCQSTSRRETKGLISESSLKEDFKIFQKTVEEAHPGLYWYNDKKEMDLYFDSLFQKIDHPMGEEELFKMIILAVARIRCVHTRISLSENTKRSLIATGKLMPIKIAIIGGRAVVTENFDSLPAPGFALTTINGIPVSEIIDQMMKIIPADGFNKSHKYFVLKRGFPEAYALLFGQPDTFNIAGEDSSKRMIQYTLKAKTPDQLRPPPDSDSIPVKQEFFNADKIALLSIKTFSLNSSFFNDRVDSFFSEIEKNKINKLIIDIRNNEGGNNSNVTTLFSYLSYQPFLHLKRTEMKSRALTYHDNISNYSQFNNIRATKTPDGDYQVDHIYPGRTLSQPVKKHGFSGTLIVLVNGGTVSAASEFAALVHGYNRGILIGEEAGGCYYGATGGNYLDLVLPNSGIRITVPTVKILIAVPEDLNNQPVGRGVIPEYNITPTFSDLVNHIDPEMNFAIKFLRKTQPDSSRMPSLPISSH